MHRDLSDDDRGKERAFVESRIDNIVEVAIKIVARGRNFRARVRTRGISGISNVTNECC